MRKLLFVLASVLISHVLFAQGINSAQSIARNSFFAEGGSAGIMFSANIDHRFTQSNLGFGGRIGLGFVTAYEYDTSTYYYSSYDDQVSTFTVPVQLNYIFGKGNSPHTFEVGAGLTFVGKKLEIMNFYDDKQSQLFATFSFMYRRQPKDGGFSWRAGFTPLIAKGYIQPFGGVGIGYNF
jgi:hypothetical protein